MVLQVIHEPFDRWSYSLFMSHSTDGLLSMLHDLLVEPIDRWAYSTQAPPASSDGSEARRFSRTVVPIDRWCASQRLSCLVDRA